jgi:hypothetical protein
MRLDFELANDILNIVKDLFKMVSLFSKLIYECVNLIGVLLGL